MEMSRGFGSDLHRNITPVLIGNSSFAMILSLSRILGGFPFNENGVSIKWVAISTIMKLIHISILASEYVHRTRDIPGDSLMKVFIIVRDVTVCLPLLFHFHRMCFDRKFFDLMKPILLAKVRTWLVALVLFLVLAWEVFTYSYLVWTFGWSPPTQISHFTLFMTTLQYVLFIGVKEKRVSKLRFELKHDPIAVCVQLHSVNSSVDQMHKMFSTQLLFATFHAVINGTFYGFFVLGQYEDVTNHMRKMAVVGLSMNLMWLLTILWRCSQFENQIKAFYAELFRVVWNQNLYSNKKLMLYLLTQRTVKFSVCGFFTLGSPLFTSIIAAATTYLVILIQFN